MITCPVCQSQAVRRSSRRGLMEHLRSWTGHYPYRCYDCQTRFFALRVAHSISEDEGASDAADKTREAHEHDTHQEDDE